MVHCDTEHTCAVPSEKERERQGRGGRGGEGREGERRIFFLAQAVSFYLVQSKHQHMIRQEQTTLITSLIAISVLSHR